jgi:hypothetical protein
VVTDLATEPSAIVAAANAAIRAASSSPWAHPSQAADL